MRRNRNTSRGGGGGNLNRSNGPFLTDHLKDIDLELDLLKRKREMLEQQQQLIQPLMPQRSFNQQPYYLLEPKQSGSNRDFSHLYNDGSQQYRKPYGRKRQSDSDWQHSSYPKRSAGQGQRGSSSAGPSSARNQRSYGGQNQQTKSTPYKYGQGKQFIGQKINNQKQQRPSKNFVANKVTKATKAFVPPNKLASHPVADRNKLVAAAIMSVAEVETRDREALRLLPDQVPTKQMTGRLELALGAILRDIRDKCAESSHHEMLRTTSLQRVIKQAIRERIRSAMLGKVVGATQEIVKEYRAMYPKDTDMEIVNIALEAGGIKPEKDPKPIVLQKDRPEEYFKVSMIKLIDTHLHEMFDKIEEIYKAENGADTSQEVAGQDNNMQTNNEPVGAVAEETVVAPHEGNMAAVNNEVDATANIENTEAVKSDSIETGKNENLETANGVNLKAGNGDKIEASNGENAETASGENIPAASTENSAVTNTENIANAENGDVGHSNIEQLFSHANEYKRMLPRLLKRHIPTILKLLHLNKMYKRAVADITTTTRTKFLEYGKSEDSSTIETSEPSQTPKKFPTPFVVLPYYVKVMGKPQLPKKKVMNTFLEVFNPKSIKKHRAIHNLLFIGFTEKSDFDAIVQADGTVIGRSTLSIRVCDKNNGKRDEKAQNDSSSSSTDQIVSQGHETFDTNLDIKVEPVADSDLGNELDGQIKDSIVKEGEVDGCIKTENQEDEKVNGNTEEAADKDEMVGDSDKVENTNDLATDTEKIENVGDTENSDKVENTDDLATDTEKTENAGDTENSDKVENTDDLATDTEKTENAGDTENSDKVENTDDLATNTEKTENAGDTENIESKNKVKAAPQEKQPAVDEKNDQLAELKNTEGRATPTRASTRLANTPAAPSSIRTRRASRLMQN